MKKQLGKKEQRTTKTLQLYAVCDCPTCSCSGCASVPSSDYMNVQGRRDNSLFSSIYQLIKDYN